MTLILASKSPRRKELLTQLGYRFETANADIDESVILDENPSEYVERLAIQKAQTIIKTLSHDAVITTLVLGSDTCVVCQNEILGQPLTKADAVKQLSALSGRTHYVYTAVAVCRGSESKSVIVRTEVTFKTLSLAEINAYWKTGEPQDKAGSYGIQGIAGQFVKHIKGSYSSVVGLPLYETAQLLAEFNCLTPLQGEQ